MDETRHTPKIAMHAWRRVCWLLRSDAEQILRLHASKACKSALWEKFGIPCCCCSLCRLRYSGAAAVHPYDLCLTNSF